MLQLLCISGFWHLSMMLGKNETRVLLILPQAASSSTLQLLELCLSYFCVHTVFSFLKALPYVSVLFCCLIFPESLTIKEAIRALKTAIERKDRFKTLGATQSENILKPNLEKNAVEKQALILLKWICTKALAKERLF